ncbi:uncharacterized protein LOC123891687 [Trifolium pratense]|uniref:uncharacterized protein LOC123891687 n=1 Tax=Trifolium pratense TaxID=57577 RepID=UPI001E690E5C|nr:uncharacterized protein LOC123891687 [Trifolium pratense]
MVNETKTYDSMKYDDDGERIVMLFGVNIAKKPAKVDDTIKNIMEDINSIHGDNKNEISIHDTGESSDHEKMEKEFEHQSENENGNDDDNNRVPELELAIGQSANHGKIKREFEHLYGTHYLSGV